MHLKKKKKTLKNLAIQLRVTWPRQKTLTAYCCTCTWGLLDFGFPVHLYPERRIIDKNASSWSWVWFVIQDNAIRDKSFSQFFEKLTDCKLTTHTDKQCQISTALRVKNYFNVTSPPLLLYSLRGCLVKLCTVSKLKHTHSCLMDVPSKLKTCTNKVHYNEPLIPNYMQVIVIFMNNLLIANRTKI